MKLILTNDDGTVIDSWDSTDEYSLDVFDAVRQVLSGPTKMELGIMLAIATKEGA